LASSSSEISCGGDEFIVRMPVLQGGRPPATGTGPCAATAPIVYDILISYEDMFTEMNRDLLKALKDFKNNKNLSTEQFIDAIYNVVGAFYTNSYQTLLNAASEFSVFTPLDSGDELLTVVQTPGATFGVEVGCVYDELVELRSVRYAVMRKVSNTAAAMLLEKGHRPRKP